MKIGKWRGNRDGTGAAAEERRRARRDLVQNMVITLLFLSAAALFTQTQLYSLGIHKGAALERLRARFAPTRTICAGDSVIDIPMLLAADVAILPGEELLGTGPGRRTCPAGRRFPDFVLETVLEEAGNS